MYINLQLSEEQCELFLFKMGYKVETITLYTTVDIDPYGKQQKIVGHEWKVAYEGIKPKELCKNHPLFEECRKYLYNSVVQEVFSKSLFTILMQHI